MEKRHNYVRKAAELATQFYINPAINQPNVTGLILAGSADFKMELSQSNMFDRRLKGKILKVADVSNGGEDGFNQAIKLSAEKLGNVKFMQEIHIIGKYFEEMSLDSGKYVVGLDDTLKVLETGAVETLIVWENLDLTRYVLKNNSSGETMVKILIWSLLRTNHTKDVSFVAVLVALERFFATSLMFEILMKKKFMKILMMLMKFMKIPSSNQPTSVIPVCRDARGVGPDSGDRSRQMDGLHKEIKSRVVSSRLSEQYEGRVQLINAGAGVKQEVSTGARGLAPGFAAHLERFR
ncbi:hypothetical protein P3S67_029825 [Capsicum chacoense]